MDKKEIQQMLGRLYDFSKATEKMWNKLEYLLDQWGVTKEEYGYDVYVAVCDGCAAKAGFINY